MQWSDLILKYKIPVMESRAIKSFLSDLGTWVPIPQHAQVPLMSSRVLHISASLHVQWVPCSHRSLLASWKCFSFSFPWVYYKQVGWRGRFYICLWSRCNPRPCWSLLEARSTLVAARQGKSVSSARRISLWALAREHPSWIRAPFSRPLLLSSRL